MSLLVAICRHNPILGEPQPTCHLYGTACTATLDRKRKAVVVVAVYLHARLNALHAVGNDDVALNAVYVCADDTLARGEADAIASAEWHTADNAQLTTPHDSNRAYIFAHGLGRIKRGDTRALTREHILPTIAREALLGVGRELHLRAPHRGASAVWACSEGLVNLTAVVAHDIFDVVVILESSLNLERHNARIYKVTDTLREVEVLDREEVFSSYQLFATPRDEVVGEATGLRALAPISRAWRLRAREIASTAMPHTYSPMHEALEVDGRSPTYSLNLVERQRTLQDDALEATPLQEERTLRCHIAYLRRGMKRYREPHLVVGHILHNESIDTYVYKLACQRLSTLQLALIEDGV